MREQPTGRTAEQSPQPPAGYDRAGSQAHQIRNHLEVFRYRALAIKATSCALAKGNVLIVRTLQLFLGQPKGSSALLKANYNKKTLK
ncbi:MAG: hypothetical protein C5B47_05475 [Verrucomicrobia bacterium]|nr:MAG: hypothetical protein C5B47_05475 [Verrucomicrobiota bacterium]